MKSRQVWACQYHKYKKGKVIVSDLKNIVMLSFLTFQVFLVNWVSSIFPHLVEAICIHLCDRFPQARRQSTADGRTEYYTSRWRLVLSEYNAVRTRLLNSILTPALATEGCFCGCPEEYGKRNFTVHTVHQKQHCTPRVSTPTYAWS